MEVANNHEAMLRKPILMPPSMIERVDEIAKLKNVSFAQVVRDAINAFGQNTSTEDIAILEALADTMLKTVHDNVSRIEALEKKLDETHEAFEAREACCGN